MKFVEFGNRRLKTIVLLHGGGLSWWSLKNIAEGLKDTYHIVIPIIDGHGEDGVTEFISIEDSAEKLINYIKTEYDGKVYAIGGLSLGAQITAEVLSKKYDIAEYAVIESALVIPIKGTKALVVPSFKLFYALINKRWFSKLQAKSLCVSDEQFDQYYADSIRITKESLINITLSNGTYSMKGTIKNTKAKVLILAGSKELGVMKKSALKLHAALPGSTLHIAQNMKHGEMSMVHQGEYISLLRSFFS